jgi:hypothetical protein
MLSKQSIKLIHIAAREAGLITRESDGRYRLLLAQYKRPNGKPVESCVQLNNRQFDDILAICEAHGWRSPGKEANHYRAKIAAAYDTASFPQQDCIKMLAGDMGWQKDGLATFVSRMTGGRTDEIAMLQPSEAGAIIEALKNILSRRDGVRYSSIEEIADKYNRQQDDNPLPTFEELQEATDGQIEEESYSNCDC